MGSLHDEARERARATPPATLRAVVETHAPNRAADRVSPGGGWLAPSLLIALGLVVRGIWWAEWAALPFWSYHRLDAAWYRAAGTSIAAGDWLMGSEVLHMSPLYSWFCGALYLLLGDADWPVPAAQFVLSALTLWWIWRAAATLLERRWALATLGAAAVFAPLVFYGPQHVATTLATAMAAWQLKVMVAAVHPAGRERMGRWALLGLASGLGVLVRPNVLLLLPLIGLFALGVSARDVATRVVRAAVFSVCALLPIVPVTARNVLVADDFVLVTDSGGLNFYLGNGPGASGTFRVPPEIPQATNADEQFRLFEQYAEDAAGRELKASEVDAWWYAQTRAHIAAHPDEWLRVMARKVALFFNGTDIPNTYSLPFAREVSPMMMVLPGFAWLGPFALLGIAVLLVDRRAESRIVGLSAGLFVAMLALFFVLGHYRLPAIPTLLVAGGAAAAALERAVRSRRAGALAAMGAVLAAGVALAVWPMTPSTLDDEFFKLGYAWQTQGNPDAAELAYGQALAHNPQNLSALKNLAVLLGRQGRNPEAIAVLRQMVAVARALGDEAREQEAVSLLAQLGATP